MQPGGELPLAVLLPSIRQNPPERIDAAVEFQGIDVNANVDKTMGEDTNSVTQQPEKRPAKRQRNSIALSADDNEEISVPEKFAVGLGTPADVKSFLANVVYVPGRVFGLTSVPLDVSGRWRCGRCLTINVFKRKLCVMCCSNKRGRPGDYGSLALAPHSKDTVPIEPGDYAMVPSSAWFAYVKEKAKTRSKTSTSENTVQDDIHQKPSRIVLFPEVRRSVLVKPLARARARHLAVII